MHFKSRTSTIALAAFAMPAFIAGCAMTVPVKDMLENREKFLATHFNPEKLQPPVRTVVDRSKPPAPLFKTMRLTYKIDLEEDGRPKKTVDATMLVVSAGNGLFQTQSELSNNGFPYRVNNALDYLGMNRLMWQTGFHNRSDSSLTYEVKEVKRFDGGLYRAKPGAEFTFEGTTGSTVQIATFAPTKVVCKAGEWRAASTVLAKLTGQAMPFECNRVDSNQTPVSKNEFLYLKDYGFALHLSSKSSQESSVYSFTDVQVTN